MLDKVAVVGVGAVGQACAFALMLRGSAREIVLADRTAERAAGSGDRHALLWNLKGYVNNARPRVRIRAAP